MSVTYQAVSWSRQKRIYDGCIALVVALVLGSYVGLSLWRFPDSTAETLIIRGTALTAVLLFHALLCIGPLARLDSRFAPFLFNRRHLGVTIFSLGLIHASLSLFQFHALGDANPIASLFTSYAGGYLDWKHFPARFPFEPLGFGALVILFLLAASSHDFWLKNLGPSLWKCLHIGVYLAYALLVGHVFWGFILGQESAFYPTLFGLGFATVVTLQLIAGAKEKRRELFDVGAVNDWVEGRGRRVSLNGVRIAVYLSGGNVYAMSDVCRHQGGPISDGKIVDGCVTCPWHGWTYRPEDGRSPPPFQEELETYLAEIREGRVWVSGTATALSAKGQRGRSGKDDFYIGYLPRAPGGIADFSKRVLFFACGLFLLISSPFSLSQGAVDEGSFDFGVVRPFTGILRLNPFPYLEATESLVLVGEGKHGAPQALAAFDGQRVELQGSLIRRKHMMLLEVHEPDRVRVIDAKPANPPALRTVLGVQRLVGEIVDTKCFAGVMRPATGKVHRACAIRCLSGGVPPGLLVRMSATQDLVLLLAGADSKPLKLDPELAGIPVEISGMVEILDRIPVLEVQSVDPI